MPTNLSIPYVIDNQSHRMADVLRAILAEHQGRSLDVATAYFNVQGFELLRNGLLGLGSFRLLLGDEPAEGASVGLRPRAARALAAELNASPYTEELLRAVEELIAFLQRPEVAVRAYADGFLHAKAYLFYGDRPSAGWDRFQPVAAIVGSSNLTAGGLTTNRELNIAHKAVLSDEDLADDLPYSLWPDLPRAQPSFADIEQRRVWKSSVGARAIADLDAWFEMHWEASRDFKDELIALLDASKFGTVEYSPYQIYLKALFEYFRDDLGDTEAVAVTRSAVDLAEFQEDAVKKARKILARYDGVLIGDSVGLGKTWIGKKLLEDHAYHLRQKALVVCPASLRDMWRGELHEATIPAQILSQEELGQAEFDLSRFGDADVILVDEAHNFRNKSTQRYENFESLIAENGGRGRDGQRKKVILLSATPINNDILDLYHELSLFTGGDRAYFAGAGIGDLHRYFSNARRDGYRGQTGAALYNLLEEVVIRRTRAFIRRAYPTATIRGEPVRWPNRKLKTVHYDLESTYAGIYERIVAAIDNLRLAPYRLESYKRQGIERDEFEEGRQEALVGIFKSRYLKRFESSVEAFRISVRRALEFLKTFESYVLDGRVLKSADFQKAMRFIEREDIEDDATPRSLAADLDASAEAQVALADLPTLDAAEYDLRHLHEALQNDVDTLTEVWHEIRDLRPSADAKLQRLKVLLAGELRGRKVLLFTYYRDTARYLYRELAGEEGAAWRENAGNPHIRRIDSGEATGDRARLIQAFAPRANGRDDLVGADDEIDLLISTDVLSEGQNLQDCGVVVNYDLHWNPTRMVQRAGRVDRLLSPFETISIFNMFPEEGLERLLGLVESLSRKISDIDKTGFLDSSVLGETVHPLTFNTLRRIEEEDDSVVVEQEEFAELASGEFLEQLLRNVLEAGGRQMLEELPDGIHSGLAREGQRGIFFYFTAPAVRGEGREHFWRYYDVQSGHITDNRYLIANLIGCSTDTPRVVGDAEVFAIQEKVIDHILSQVTEKVAIEEAPKILDPLQQTVATTLRGLLNHPEVERSRVSAALLALATPLPSTRVRALRAAYQEYGRSREVGTFLARVEEAAVGGGSAGTVAREPARDLKRQDLHLVCFDWVWS